MTRTAEAGVTTLRRHRRSRDYPAAATIHLRDNGGQLRRDLPRKRDELVAAARRDGQDPAEITGWRWPT
ncbi:hypothetical protein AB0K15_20835 [Amycolatopsis sp. NPDC049253]|uniref:hypothetical protein n=1 Tax=Amycolatopsis sp. NPDC049253 TaxID=3155274 RepID=UPI0034277FFA